MEKSSLVNKFFILSAFWFDITSTQLLLLIVVPLALLFKNLFQDKDISSHPREPCIFWTSCLRMG